MSPGSSDPGATLLGEYTGTVKEWDLQDNPPSFVEHPVVTVVTAGTGAHQLEARHLDASGNGQVVDTTLFDVTFQTDGSFTGQSSTPFVNRSISGQISVGGSLTAQSNKNNNSTVPHDYSASKVP